MLSIIKLYQKLGDAEKVESLILELLADKDNIPARYELGKLFHSQNNDKRKQTMYIEILAKILQTLLSSEGTHIEKHTNNDLAKPIHGVFNGSPQDIIFDIIKDNRTISLDGEYLPDKGYFIYQIDCGKRCGYRGGNEGDNEPLQFITLIINSNLKILTLYPDQKLIKRISWDPRRL